MSNTYTVNGNVQSNAVFYNNTYIRNPYYCQVALGNSTSTIGASNTEIDWNAASSTYVRQDNTGGSMYSTGTPTKVLIVSTGLYSIWGGYSLGDFNAGQVGVKIFKNGSQLTVGGAGGTANVEWWANQDGTGKRQSMIRCVTNLTSGDQISLVGQLLSALSGNTIRWANLAVEKLA